MACHSKDIDDNWYALSCCLRATQNQHICMPIVLLVNWDVCWHKNILRFIYCTVATGQGIKHSYNWPLYSCTCCSSPIRSTYISQITYWIINTWPPVQLVLIQARKDCRYLRWDLYWIRSRGLPTPYWSPCLPPPLYYLILMDLLNPSDVGFGIRWLHSSPAPGWLIFWVC